jgi:hypothetical protein
MRIDMGILPVTRAFREVYQEIVNGGGEGVTLRRNCFIEKVAAEAKLNAIEDIKVLQRNEAARQREEADRLAADLLGAVERTACGASAVVSGAGSRRPAWLGGDDVWPGLAGSHAWPKGAASGREDFSGGADIVPQFTPQPEGLFINRPAGRKAVCGQPAPLLRGTGAGAGTVPAVGSTAGHLNSEPPSFGWAILYDTHCMMLHVFGLL